MRILKRYLNILFLKNKTYLMPCARDFGINFRIIHYQTISDLCSNTITVYIISGETRNPNPIERVYWHSNQLVQFGKLMRLTNLQIPECTCSISHNAPFRTEMGTFLFWMAQIPECTCSISHNAPFRTEMGTFLFWMAQIPECTCSISYNAPFRTEMGTFLFWMEHCEIWNRCILGFVKLACCPCDVIEHRT